MNGALASWIPPDVLVGFLSLVVGYLLKRILAESKETKDAIKDVRAEIVKLQLQQTGFATKEAASNMGERFTAQLQAQDTAHNRSITELSVKIAELKAQG